MIEFERNRRLEDELVTAALHHELTLAFLRRAAHELNAFADERALPGPVRRRDGQDFVQEAREELADARNYLVWHAQVLRREADADARLVKVYRALVALVETWRLLAAIESDGEGEHHHGSD